MQRIELQLLLEAIYQRYGCDFRDYSDTHLERRILQRVRLSGFSSISEMQHRVLYDPDFFSLLFADLSINVTELFRNPAFFRAVREVVLPELRQLPHLKIWHAGCASGEEVYSMAILLKEEGLLEKSRIFATDFNAEMVRRASQGIFPMRDMKTYSRNYLAAGGKHSLSDYYVARYSSVLIDPSLRARMTFSPHNLAMDGPFGEMQMVVCRNVMIYFNDALQEKVIQTFSESLPPGGFLCLGSRERLGYGHGSKCFEPVRQGDKIYRRVPFGKNNDGHGQDTHRR